MCLRIEARVRKARRRVQREAILMLTVVMWNGGDYADSS